MPRIAWTNTVPSTIVQRDDRIHLIVLYGGQSAEHDVSCTTAAHVLQACDPARYRITPIGISRDGIWSLDTAAQAAIEAGPHTLPGRLDPVGTTIAASPFLSEAISCDTPGTTVVMPLLHGPMGEDGTVQGLLELVDVAYVGSGVLGSALAMDKAMAKQVCAASGIIQARHRAVREHDITPSLPAELAEELGLPVFVKPANMGSSVGVSKAKTVEALRDALQVALRYDEWIVVEEAVTGREIEVGVLGNLEPRASVPGEILPSAEFYDYADKYLDDGSRSVIPASLSPDAAAHVRELAVRVFLALRCEGMARVDFFYEEATPDQPGRGFLLNEVNTIPGFTPISMFPKLWIASGVSYPALIDELVRLAIERHSRRRRNTSR
jgi:D-alanine-D-alanine ligase